MYYGPGILEMGYSKKYIERNVKQEVEQLNLPKEYVSKIMNVIINPDGLDKDDPYHGAVKHIAENWRPFVIDLTKY